MSAPLRFSPMTHDDLPEVMELEQASFAIPWAESFFRDELTREYSHFILARDADGLLVGFVCFWVLLGEMHILNLAVRESHRRKGVGSVLAVRAVKAAKRLGAKAATLEVRESNTAAIALYKRLGFARAGLRPRYYEKPRENAVIMWRYDMELPGAKSP